MRQASGIVPTYIVLGLAALAALVSVQQPRPEVRAALMWLLVTQGAAEPSATIPRQKPDSLMLR